eukprot:COSAG02_NODE_6525_length_3519_cov_3.419298_4_plen_58_part_00
MDFVAGNLNASLAEVVCLEGSSLFESQEFWTENSMHSALPEKMYTLPSHSDVVSQLH